MNHLISIRSVILTGLVLTCVACNKSPKLPVGSVTTASTPPQFLWPNQGERCYENLPCSLNPKFDSVTGKAAWRPKVYEDLNTKEGLSSIVVLVNEVNLEAGRFIVDCPSHKVSLLAFKGRNDEEFVKAGWFSGKRTGMASLPDSYKLEILSHFCF